MPWPDVRGIAARFSARLGDYVFIKRPDRIWRPSNFIFSRWSLVFRGVKAAEGWRWQITTSSCKIRTCRAIPLFTSGCLLVAPRDISEQYLYSPLAAFLLRPRTSLLLIHYFPPLYILTNILFLSPISLSFLILIFCLFRGFTARFEYIFR